MVVVVAAEQRSRTVDVDAPVEDVGVRVRHADVRHNRVGRDGGGREEEDRGKVHDVVAGLSQRS